MISQPIQKHPKDQKESGMMPSAVVKFRRWGCAIVPVVALLAPMSAQAAAIFTGSYQPGNWTQVNPTFGHVTPNPVGLFTDTNSIDLIGDNGGSTPQHYIFQIQVPSSATGTTWSFHYRYTTGITSNTNEAGYISQSIVGGVPTYSYHQVVNGSSLVKQGNSGAIAFDPVTRLIGFYVYTTSIATFTRDFLIDGFSAPDVSLGSPVPEPASLSLFALGAFGLRMAKRRTRSIPKTA